MSINLTAQKSVLGCLRFVGTLGQRIEIVIPWGVGSVAMGGQVDPMGGQVGRHGGPGVTGHTAFD
eukprot:4680862-Prymnesium_polylepis.1